MPGSLASAAVLVACLLGVLGAMYWWFQWRLEVLTLQQSQLERHVSTLEALWSIGQSSAEEGLMVGHALEVLARGTEVDVAVQNSGQWSRAQYRGADYRGPWWKNLGGTSW